MGSEEATVGTELIFQRKECREMENQSWKLGQAIA